MINEKNKHKKIAFIGTFYKTRPKKHAKKTIVELRDENDILIGYLVIPTTSAK